MIKINNGHEELISKLLSTLYILEKGLEKEEKESNAESKEFKNYFRKLYRMTTTLQILIAKGNKTWSDAINVMKKILQDPEGDEHIILKKLSQIEDRDDRIIEQSKFLLEKLYENKKGEEYLKIKNPELYLHFEVFVFNMIALYFKDKENISRIEERMIASRNELINSVLRDSFTYGKTLAIPKEDLELQQRYSGRYHELLEYYQHKKLKKVA